MLFTRSSKKQSFQYLCSVNDKFVDLESKNLPFVGTAFSIKWLTFVSFLSLLCFLYMYIPDFYKYIIWKVNLSVVLVCAFPAFCVLSILNPYFVCAPEYYPGVTLLAIAESYPEVLVWYFWSHSFTVYYFFFPRSVSIFLMKESLKHFSSALVLNQTSCLAMTSASTASLLFPLLRASAMC